MVEFEDTLTAGRHFPVEHQRVEPATDPVVDLRPFEVTAGGVHGQHEDQLCEAGRPTPRADRRARLRHQHARRLLVKLSAQRSELFVDVRRTPLRAVERILLIVRGGTRLTMTATSSGGAT